MNLEKLQSKAQALFIGILVGAISALLIASIVFVFHKSNTSELNDTQRFRAVCEQANGIAVERYCISGNTVLPITID